MFLSANKKHVDNWTGMLKLVVEETLMCSNNSPDFLETFHILPTLSIVKTLQQ